MDWHLLTTDQTIEKLHSSFNGLSVSKAKERLKQCGPNLLQDKKKKAFADVLFGQFKDLMIIILILAAIVSGIVGDVSDTIVIAIIVVLNAIVGAVQEHRAENALKALKKMTTSYAFVKREGHFYSIPSAELVPGDLVVLNAGDMVPADLRITESYALKINEASLTGESFGIEKNVIALHAKDLPLGDRINMAYKGTLTAYGRGVGIVVATGMQTEIGSIAKMLKQTETKTPLQKRLAGLSKRLSIIVLGICIIIFAHGLIRGEEPLRMLLTAISVAVAAIPEALPAVIIIALAIGARRMVRKNVIIRKLPAVETLGSVTYICTDKTGTLTQNKMSVKDVWTDETEKIYQKFSFLQSPKQLLLYCIALNQDTTLNEKGEITGDPTEIALIEFLRDTKEDKIVDEELPPRLHELPFDSERKMMSTIHKVNDNFLIVTKGAVESISKICVGTSKEAVLIHADDMASQGLRVIAYSCKLAEKIPKAELSFSLEKHQHFIGLVGMIDPLRPGVTAAVEECKKAGIIPVMITGDHPSTAKAIAVETGILQTENDIVISGAALSKLTESEFEMRIRDIKVYARVTPQQKLQVVKALQKQHQFVAMTGDGVNDAPALKQADIGIAMGIMGTDVSKEAGAMVLLDDNFATIVKAVKEGRRIYDNIRKFIQYVLTCNSAEVWVIFLAPLMSLPIPLLPIQILWINLVTDSLPGLALTNEPAEENIMRRSPRHPGQSVFAEGLGLHVLWVGLFMAAVCLVVETLAIKASNAYSQTMVFTVLCFTQMANVLAIKNNEFFLFQKSFFQNISLPGTVILTIILQLALIYIPFLQIIFHTKALSLNELLVCVAASVFVFIAIEMAKLFRKKSHHR